MNKQQGRENDSVAVERVVAKSEVAAREEVIQEFWRERDIFNKSLATPGGGESKGEFVFYDGPPFATGTPHYGHILAGTIKDAVPRFWTMNGFRVRRKWGWDCHGLPLENLIEKKLGLATKRDIETYGVKNFNEAARDAVMEYADEWKRVVPRMGRFVDMEDDYKTMDSPYTESVWWVFSELHKKGLVYEGFKTMHLCPRCGTTLSNFEVNQGYKDIKDIAVTVRLPLLDEAGVVTDTALLVWTTTPWTLPGNLAAAVHNEITYVKVRVTTETEVSYVIIAKGRLAQLDGTSYEVLEEMPGTALVGRSYQPPFTYLKQQDFDQTNAWKIYHADYVELGEEGTGAVHIAPAYGDDDMKLAQAHQVPIMHHVDTAGHFMDFVTDFKGQLVKPKDDDAAGVDHKAADVEVLKKLQELGLVFKKENITHSYPHCWRCDTPLLNYATTSWFVAVTNIKDQLVAENAKVSWVPEHVGANRFGKWLEGARDWAVSRQRYWGAPLPIWKNPTTGEYKVLGSLADLKALVPKSGNTYLLMRHAEADSNLTGAIDAIPDENNPLTAAGQAQCVAAAATLKGRPIDLIIHSGMQRTRETALAVAHELGLPTESVIADARMIELQTGTALEGLTWSEYEALYTTPEEKFTKVIPGVENRRDVLKRVGEFLYDIDASYQGKTILIVGHASSTFAFRSVAEGADIPRAIEIRLQGYMNNAEVIEVPFTPLPHNDFYELDYHRPYIDDIKLTDSDGTPLVRVPDVFDCWFESGSMPYAETHYPFEHLLEANPAEGVRFPANFISESVDQTRGWFYSMMVLGVALFGTSPFKHVITNGLVLAEDGKKMSKSLKNYPDPMELADRTGVDAMRYYLLSSSIIRGEDLNFSEKEVLELQRKNIGRLHNVLAMYEMYADGTPAASTSPQVLDRWIIARLHELIVESTAGYKSYELDKATRPIADFIDDVTVWYLRRSRERLKSDDAADKALALGTLRYVLTELAKIMAPVMPFYAEYLYLAVKEGHDIESVHLAAWPVGGAVDATLIATMREVRTLISEALELRTKANIKVRQPLAELRIAEGVSIPDEFKAIIQDELNVKSVLLHYKIACEPRSSVLTGRNVELTTELTDALVAEGAVREVMRAIQELRKAADLAPADRIVVTVGADAAAQQAMIVHHDLIVKTVGADEFVFSPTEGVTVVAGNYTFTLAIALVK